LTLASLVQKMSLRQLRQKVCSVVFFIVTFSYNWELQHYTLKPIAKILESEKNSIYLGPLSDVTGLVRLLVGWLEMLQKSQPVRSFDWLAAG